MGFRFRARACRAPGQRQGFWRWDGFGELASVPAANEPCKWCRPLCHGSVLIFQAVSWSRWQADPLRVCPACGYRAANAREKPAHGLVFVGIHRQRRLSCIFQLLALAECLERARTHYRRAVLFNWHALHRVAELFCRVCEDGLPIDPVIDVVTSRGRSKDEPDSAPHSPQGSLFLASSAPGLPRRLHEAEAAVGRLGQDRGRGIGRRRVEDVLGSGDRRAPLRLVGSFGVRNEDARAP